MTGLLGRSDVEVRKEMGVYVDQISHGAASPLVGTSDHSVPISRLFRQVILRHRYISIKNYR